jgi:SIR2-like domain
VTAAADRPDRKPYRYLDYFDEADKDLYFGRDREIRILTSDIVVSRLVVLFAKTGTGKTSLINAGVRPRLEPDYRTLWLRVEDDPVKAARDALRDAGLLPRSRERDPLYQQLRSARRRAKKPIVLFFDQFEEFFERITAPEQRRRFVGEIADVYEDRQGDACVVLSMREEYFHELDEFRERVPSIFHKSSNLRLRPLDADQAREAIVEPAKLFGTVVEDELVDTLITDLATDAGVPPANLQIVCDTLWNERADDAVTIGVDDYLALGGHGAGSPADRIYERRVEEDIGDSLTVDSDLELFRRLMPTLRTDNKTKRPKELSELVEELGADTATLDRLVGRLQGIGLLRVLPRYGAVHIEWTSDYLAGRTDDLMERTRKLYLLRLVVRGLDERRRQAAHRPKPGEPRPAPLELEALRALSEHEALIDAQIGADAAEYLFSASLYHGERMRLWADVARDRGVDVWSVLKRSINDDTAPLEEAGNALRFLVESEGEEAQRLLRLALRQDSLASLAVDVIADSGNDDTTRLLAATLKQPALAAHTVAALGQQSSVVAAELLAQAARARQPGEVALAAATALYRLSTGRPSSATRTAGRLLDDLLGHRAEAFLVQALDLGLEALFWFEQAVAHGFDAWAVLERTVTDPQVPERRARNALGLLGVLAVHEARQADVRHALELLETAVTDPRLAERAVEVVSGLSSTAAVRLLERALERESTTLHAAKSLYDIASRRTGKASTDADDVVQQVLGARAEALFLRAMREGESPRFWFDRARDYQVSVWTILREAVEQSGSDPATAGHAVRLLGQLADDPATRREALELLGQATRQERVAAAAVSAVGEVRAREAVDLLGSLLDDADLGARATRALEDLADGWNTPPELQQRANTLLGRSPGRTPAPGAVPSSRTRSRPPGEPLDVAERFTSLDWERLLRSIADGMCLPVLGQDVSPSLPPTRTVARQWAENYDYPMSGQPDLPDVAQYLQTTDSRGFLDELVQRVYDAASVPVPGIHAVLARLPVRIYLTLGFDDLLERALAEADRHPRVGYANWRGGHLETSPGPEPSDDEPLVYHLYGHLAAPESLVLTGQDHLRVLQWASDRPDEALRQVERALSRDTLLLLGVNPMTLSGQVLLELGERPTLLRRPFQIAVQPQDPEEAGSSGALDYLREYLGQRGIRAYWGEVGAFCAELDKRWRPFVTAR